MYYTCYLHIPVDERIIVGWIALANELDVAHQHLMEIAAQLSPELRDKNGVCGEWSPRQVITHLIGWDREAVHFLMLFADGRGDSYDPDFDINDFNTQSVKSREHLSWNEVMADLGHTHVELQKIIVRLYFKDLPSDNGFGRALIGRIEDYQLHARQLAAWCTS